MTPKEPDAPVVNSADVRLRSELPWIEHDHRCEHRAAAADRKLYADEFHARYRETAAELERTRAAVLAIHKAVPTWTDSTYDTATGETEQNALYDDAGVLIYAPNYRLHCQNCRVDTEWPCPTAQAVGVTRG